MLPASFDDAAQQSYILRRDHSLLALFETGMQPSVLYPQDHCLFGIAWEGDICRQDCTFWTEICTENVY